MSDFRCTKCDKHFSTGASLRSHTSTYHRAGFDYSALICTNVGCKRKNLSFRTPQTLLSHQKYCGKNSVKLICPNCSKEFKFRRNLTTHQKHCYNNGKLFQCSLCKKNFVNSKELQNHKCSYVKTMASTNRKNITRVRYGKICYREETKMIMINPIQLHRVETRFVDSDIHLRACKLEADVEFRSNPDSTIVGKSRQKNKESRSVLDYISFGVALGSSGLLPGNNVTRVQIYSAEDMTPSANEVNFIQVDDNNLTADKDDDVNKFEILAVNNLLQGSICDHYTMPIDNEDEETNELSGALVDQKISIDHDINHCQKDIDCARKAIEECYGGLFETLGDVDDTVVTSDKVTDEEEISAIRKMLQDSLPPLYHDLLNEQLQEDSNIG